MGKYAVKCGKLFDSVDGKVRENITVMVDDERIVEVKNGFDGLDPSYEVIDLSDRFVTAGLIDSHVHLNSSGETGSSLPRTMNTSISELTLISLKNAQRDMYAGFTTVRDEGGKYFVVEGIKRMINKGEFDGPRIFSSGVSLGTIGGHADSHYAPQIPDMNKEGATGLIVTGPVEVARAARYTIKHGADQIKLMATGGVLSDGDEVGLEEFTFEEMSAAVEMAKMAGKLTSAHCHGTKGIKTAARAGITSVEHGSLMDDEGVELMLKHGTWLVPTIIPGVRIVEKGIAGGAPEFAVRKSLEVSEHQQNALRKCYKAGVKIAFGTDIGTIFSPHGSQAYEFELMARCGFTNEDIIISATKKGAELMRLERDIGTVEAGKYADLAAFDGDLTEDIKNVSKISFVMKGGKVFRNDRA